MQKAILVPLLLCAHFNKKKWKREKEGDRERKTHIHTYKYIHTHTHTQTHTYTHIHTHTHILHCHKHIYRGRSRFFKDRGGGWEALLKNNCKKMFYVQDCSQISIVNDYFL